VSGVRFNKEQKSKREKERKREKRRERSMRKEMIILLFPHRNIVCYH
jgi:hypothetical protein